MVWEDAPAAELVEIVHEIGNAVGPARVQLTPLGKAALSQR